MIERKPQKRGEMKIFIIILMFVSNVYAFSELKDVVKEDVTEKRVNAAYYISMALIQIAFTAGLIYIAMRA